MTQRLTLFSQEVEDFVLELKIDADATFLDLHNLIQEACDYHDRHNHSFLICDEEWCVKKEESDELAEARWASFEKKYWEPIMTK